MDASEITVCCVRRGRRRLVGISGAILLGLGLTGCSYAKGIATLNGIAEADHAAPATCSKAGAEAAFATAIPVYAAVDELKAARMDTQPWSSMPSSKVIFECYPSLLPNTDGEFIDRSGQHSVAPPVGTGEHCKYSNGSTTCSGLASGS
jgi:hypothetical protein